jgi:phage terminase large subunit-like protein
LRASLASLSPAARAALLETLPAETVDTLAYDWEVWARDAQLPPAGEWVWWLVLAGRGFGKTRTGAEFIRSRVAAGARSIALIGPTAGDTRDTMVEVGPGSILKNSPPWDMPDYEPSKRRLTWKNGAVATLFSADEPERLRGPQHDTIWADELGAWRYQRETWDMAAFGFRLGEPRGIITTTPRPTEVVRELLTDPTVRVTRGSTFDNAANLAGSFLTKLVRRYEGTRLGRQELYAELLEDTPGALWTLGLLDTNRVRTAPELVRLVVAVDPQAAEPNATDEDNAETGIVAAGTDLRGDGYVLRDASGHLSPGEWGERAVLLHDELEADAIVGEVNNGGAMVGYVVRTAAEKLFREKKRPTPHINFRSVSASRGKLTRAEPIAALDEQHRVHHVGAFAQLESQMITWVPGEKSPDRMDARVWALTELMLSGAPTAGYRPAAQGLKAAQVQTTEREPRRERQRDRSDRW